MDGVVERAWCGRRRAGAAAGTARAGGGAGSRASGPRATSAARAACAAGTCVAACAGSPAPTSARSVARNNSPPTSSAMLTGIATSNVFLL